MYHDFENSHNSVPAGCVVIFVAQGTNPYRIHVLTDTSLPGGVQAEPGRTVAAEGAEHVDTLPSLAQIFDLLTLVNIWGGGGGVFYVII